MKYTIEVDRELIEWFRKNIDNTSPIEVMLPYLLELLRQILEETKKKK